MVALVLWLSVNSTVHIKKVTLCQAGLIKRLEIIAVFETTQTDSAWPSLWGIMATARKTAARVLCNSRTCYQDCWCWYTGLVSQRSQPCDGTGHVLA